MKIFKILSLWSIVMLSCDLGLDFRPFKRNPDIECILKKECIDFFMPRCIESTNEIFFLKIQPGREKYPKICRISYPDTLINIVIDKPVLGFDVSWDGERIAYIDTSKHIFLYDLEKDSIYDLEVTGSYIRFSSNGESVFFLQNGKLYCKKIYGETLYEIGKLGSVEFDISPGDSLVAIPGKIYTLRDTILEEKIKGIGFSPVFHPYIEGVVAWYTSEDESSFIIVVKNILTEDVFKIDARPYKYVWIQNNELETDIEWSSSGEEIIYSCAEAVTATGAGNYELWRIKNIEIE